MKKKAPTSPGNRSAGADILSTVTRKVSEIETATVDRMREIWRGEFGTDPPNMTRSFETFRKLLAWKVQEKYLGGLSRWANQELERLVAALDRDPSGNSSMMRLKPGMVLVREWKGVKHQVHVLDQGLRHGSKTYDSLSEVAREITGTRWSGPLFFGLKRKPKQKRAA